MREIKGYEGLYAISENGEILNLLKNTIKRPTIGNHGYCAIDLYKNGHRKTYLLHRLLAESYIENPLRKRTINHRDGNKLNNDLSNLEWATYSENHRHSFRELGRKAYMAGRIDSLNHNSKPVVMYSQDGIFIKKFESIHGAQRATGILNNAIVAHLKGKTKHAGGFTWRYANAKEN